MAAGTELSFSFPGKILGSERLGVAGPRIAHTPRGSLLSLKLLDAGDSLMSVVNCQAGCVTVIDQPAFREALLSGPAKLAVRDASREVLLSEFYVAGRSRSVWTAGTPAGVVRNCGAPAECLDHILSAIGLQESSNRALAELGECAVGRLEIVAALYSKAKYVLFDRPFVSLSAKFLEAAGDLMLNAIEDSNRFFIVTGSEWLPKNWRSSGLVQIAHDEIGHWNIVEKADHAHSALRDLARQNHHDAHDAEHGLLTRPQSFTTPTVRAAVPEALKTEAIENPKLSEFLEIDPAAPAPEPQAPRTVNSKRERRGTGELTRVSRMHFLSRWLRPRLHLRRLIKSNAPMVELVTARSTADAMTTQIRMGDVLRRRRLRFVFFVALSIAVYGGWLLVR